MVLQACRGNDLLDQGLVTNLLQIEASYESDKRSYLTYEIDDHNEMLEQIPNHAVTDLAELWACPPVQGDRISVQVNFA